MRKLLCVVMLVCSFVACEDKPLVEQVPLSPVVEQADVPAPIAPAAAAEIGDAGAGS